MKDKILTGKINIAGCEFECLVDKTNGQAYTDTFLIPQEMDEFIVYASKKSGENEDKIWRAFGRLAIAKYKNPNINATEFINNYFSK